MPYSHVETTLEFQKSTPGTEQESPASVSLLLGPASFGDRWFVPACNSTGVGLLISPEEFKGRLHMQELTGLLACTPIVFELSDWVRRLISESK